MEVVEYEVDTFKIDRTRNVNHIILTTLCMSSVQDACVLLAYFSKTFKYSFRI